MKSNDSGKNNVYLVTVVVKDLNDAANIAKVVSYVGARSSISYVPVLMCTGD